MHGNIYIMILFACQCIYVQEEEQARLTRIQQRDEAVTEFDKRVRPYIDALQQEESAEKASASGAGTNQ